MNPVDHSANPNSEQYGSGKLLNITHKYALLDPDVIHSLQLT